MDDGLDPPTKQLREAATAVKKTGHIPPIIMDIKPDWTHEIIKGLIAQHTNRFHLQYRGKNKVAVVCYTPEDHQRVKDGLRQNAAFVTYTRKDEKTPKIVIRGLPAYVEAELAGEFEKLGFKGAQVIKLKSSRIDNLPCPPFMIQFPSGMDLTKIRQIKYLFSCVINIQKYKPNRALGTQCYRCQGFGHSSRNCNLPARCVKCTEAHASTDCPKKDRLKPAYCCNCNENHPANYSKCSARLSYLQRIEKKKEAERLPRLPLKAIYTPQIGTTRKTFADVVTNKTTTPPETQETTQNPLLGDSSTKEMLEILLTIKKLKNQFIACTSMLDKVMLILTHLGQYV